MELKKLFHTDNFRINVVQDFQTVEICGALKVFLNFLKKVLIKFGMFYFNFLFRMLLLVRQDFPMVWAMETIQR